MVAYGTSISVKTFGMLMQGILHIRITLSYTHMYELVRERDKPFCAQIMNLCDTSVMAINGIIFIFFTRDAVAVMQFLYLFFTAGVLLYLTLVPESPRWLLVNGYHEEGIATLNYIALMNGVEKRLPETAEFDVLGQIIKQTEALDKVSDGALRAHEISSVISLANQYNLQNNNHCGTIIASSYHGSSMRKLLQPAFLSSPEAFSNNDQLSSTPSTTPAKQENNSNRSSTQEMTPTQDLRPSIS